MLLPRSTFVLLLSAVGLVNPLCAHAQNLPGEGDRPRIVTRSDRKIDLLYHASETYLALGTGFDMMTTVNGLGHPTSAYTSSGTFLTHYYMREVGWAAPIVGRRDATGIVFANVALNAGIDLLDRKLYRRGGRWRVAAVALNVLKGTSNMAAGFNNHRIGEGIDQAVRRETGYNGIVVWSR